MLCLGQYSSVFWELACPSFLKDACREAAFAVIRGWRVRWFFPQMVEGRTPIDERNGVLIITPQVYASRHSDIHEPALNSHTTPNGVALL